MKVQRGEKLLAELVANDKISSSGRDWLTAAIDPFHDNQLAHLTGWPDMESGASIVRCVKQSMQISVPTSLATGNWDCHVVAWPMLSSTTANYSLCTRTQNQVVGPAYPLIADNQVIGGVQVYGTPPNSNLNIMAPGGVGLTNLVGGLGLSSTYTKGSGRLIGMGFEIHNTTADLYRQGSLTVYRMLANAKDPTVFMTDNAGTTPYNGSVSCVMVRHPPRNVSDAVLTCGGRTWTAEEGCYVVCAFDSEENPASPCNPSVPVINTADNEDLDNTLNTDSLYFPVPQNVVTSNPIFRPQRVHPIHQSGAILQGLSKETTLQLNVNYYYESFPGLAEREILVLANPSAKYDPCVMELYSRVVQSLPVGVPVCENGLGDWFLDAATKAAKYLGPVLAALPHPVAKGAGAALSYLGETGGNYVKKQKKEKSSQKAPPNVWKPPPVPKLPPRDTEQYYDQVRAMRARNSRLRPNAKRTKKSQKRKRPRARSF